MISLGIDPELSEQIPFLKLRGLLFTGASGGPSPAALCSLIEAAAAQTAASLKLEEIGSLPGPAGWRKVLKALGTDPSRYRVSSERLLRRAVKGEGLPSVSALVDICNAWSLATGLPAGLYDLAKVAGDRLTFGAGRPGESYLTLAGSALETLGKPVIRDAMGPCGSPLTDSERTKTDETTERCLLVIFAPPGYQAEDLARHVELATDWYQRYAGATLAGEAQADG